jgi:ABC-type dipeptide/oligopeptide/nickel transport system permease subunit
MSAPVIPVAPDPLAAETLATARPASLWRDTLGNILRQRSAVIGLVILGVFIFVGVFAPLIAPYEPDNTLLGKVEGVTKRAAPCIHLLGCPTDQPQFIFGTDGNFRDLFSRVVYGTRISLPIGFAAVGLAILIGTFIGAISGFVGGGTDTVLMRLMDVVLAFPSLLLAIAIVTALGTSYLNAMLAITVVSIPVYARIVRSSVLSTRENDYVVASRALGESPGGVLARRVLPNAITPLIVQATLGIGTAVLEIAALSFVGVAPIGPPEWGSMVAIERGQLFSAPHVVLIPGLAITLAVLGFNLLGDGLRDALDPRLNR